MKLTIFMTVCTIAGIAFLIACTVFPEKEKPIKPQPEEDHTDILKDHTYIWRNPKN